MYPASLLTYCTTYVWLRRHKMISNCDVRLIICQCTLQNRETTGKKKLFTFFSLHFSENGYYTGSLPLVTSQRALQTTATGVHLNQLSCYCL